MSRTGYRIRSALLVVCASAILWQTGGVEPTGPRLPNVLIVTVDTLRADRLGAYGYTRNTSPTLDKLMREGVRFTQARTVEPLTGPALCSMLTSRYPHEHGASRNGLRMRSGMASLPKALQAHGYRTSAFVGNWTLRDKLSGLAEHFEYYEEILSHRRWFGLVKGEATAEDLNDAFAVWLADHTTRHNDRPFMAWIHYVEPHAPYRNQMDFHRQLGFKRGQNMGQKERYDTEIAAVDAAIGELLRIVGKKIDLDDTLIVFASDHGEELWDHAGFGHGHSVFDELLRVPLIVSGPGIAQQIVSRAVSTIDLLPTIADWTGLARDPEWRGSSWADALRRGRFDGPETPIFSQATGVLPPPPEPLQSVVLGKYKLIRGMESGQVRLYDHSRDPGELHDRSRSQPQTVAQLQAALDRWSGSFPVTFDTFGAEGNMPEPDPEMIENLKALGYLPDDSP